MVDFVSVLLIIVEIVLTIFLVNKIIILEKKVEKLNQQMIYLSNIVLELNKKVRLVISKINKFVSVVTGRKFALIKKTLQITINTIQIVMFIRSLNLSKGLGGLNYRLLKKLMIMLGLKHLIKALVF